MLLAYAAEFSPFHARRLRGLDLSRFEAGDLAGLPVMTKSQMMAEFNEVVTDRRLSRRLAEQHLAASIASRACCWMRPAGQCSPVSGQSGGWIGVRWPLVVGAPDARVREALPSAARGTGRACLAHAVALRRISRLRLTTRGNLVPGCGPTLGQDSRVFPAGDAVALVSRWGAGEFHGDVGNATAGRVDNVGRPG